jgi:hypothetical protein
VSCPLCRRRKGKRSCPAKGESICATCCGTKRRVQVDCPEDCIYLTGAHAPGWDGRETERKRDLRRVAPQLQRLTEVQSQLFLVALVGLSAMRSRRRDLDDRLLGHAVSTFRRTAATRERGILFEHRPDDMRAQGVIQELQAIFESKDSAGKPVTPPDRDLLAVLEALDVSIAGTSKEVAGPTAFLETATRLVARFAAAEPAPKPTSLIV